MFFMISFCIWMYEWSIQRYIVVLELLLGPALVVALQWCGLGKLWRGFLLPGLFAIIAVACVVTMRAADWGHLPWAKTWYSVDIPSSVGERPIVFLDGEPLSYLALEMARSVNGDRCHRMGRPSGYGRHSISSPDQRVVLADPHNKTLEAVAQGPLSNAFKKSIARYGLIPSGDCTTTTGRPFPLTWCPLIRTSPPG